MSYEPDPKVDRGVEIRPGTKFRIADSIAVQFSEAGFSVHDVDGIRNPKLIFPVADGPFIEVDSASKSPEIQQVARELWSSQGNTFLCFIRAIQLCGSQSFYSVEGWGLVFSDFYAHLVSASSLERNAVTAVDVFYSEYIERAALAANISNNVGECPENSIDIFERVQPSNLSHKKEDYFEKPDEALCEEFVFVENSRGGKRAVAAAKDVFFPYVSKNGKEYRHLAGTTGTACDQNYETAAFRAALELIERHCLASFWYNDGVANRIDPCELSLPELAYSERTTYNPHLFTIENPFQIPVAICVLESQTDQSPRYVAGTAAGLSHHRALGKAYIEALQNLHVFTRHPDNMFESSRGVNPSFANQSYYAYSARKVDFGDLLDLRMVDQNLDQMRTKTDREMQPLSFIDDRLTAVGVDVWYYVLTSPISSARRRVVVRALSSSLPGLPKIDRREVSKYTDSRLRMVNGRSPIHPF